MGNLKFEFKLKDEYTPEVAIMKILSQIEEATQGYVQGKVEVYNGPIYSYKQPSLATLLGKSSIMDDEKTIDIQDELGEIGTENHKYEVFLAVKGLPHYKYRMMFIEYGMISYPVTIVMDNELAMIYSGQDKELFKCDSMKTLQDMMEKIINSDPMIAFIQKLINEALRQEAKEKIEQLKTID